MPSIAASFVAKEVFRDVLLDFVGINFRVCRISIDPGHPSHVFDVGYVPFEPSPEAAEPPPERQYDRVNVNKPKLRNFDRPLGLPGHLQSRFLCRQRVISSKYDGAGAWQLPLMSAAEQQ